METAWSSSQFHFMWGWFVFMQCIQLGLLAAIVIRLYRGGR